MKIDKEQFDKLKQLDRIEFRQKEDRINNYFQGGVMFNFIKLTSFIVAFFILLAPQGYMLWGQEFINDLIDAARTIIGAFIFIIFIGAVIDLSINLFRIKKIKELKEEYFKEEIKVEVKK